MRTMDASSGRSDLQAPGAHRDAVAVWISRGLAGGKEIEQVPYGVNQLSAVFGRAQRLETHTIPKRNYY